MYCVKSIKYAEGLHSDFNLIAGDVRRGMAVSADAPLMTFAHELGHAFGLRDLYDYDGGDGLVSEGKVRPLNWSGGEGTGYYSPTLAYRDLAYRCIMEKTRPSATRGDIPLDSLTGMSGSIRIPVSVGLEQMTTRQPEH